VVKLPSGVFRPYAGVSTAILFFTRTDSGGTDHVWFYDVQADGFSLDDKRNPVSDNDLPDALTRWRHRDAEAERARTAQSFLVPKADIVPQSYDLSLNRYKEVVHRRGGASHAAGDHRRYRDAGGRDRAGPGPAAGDALVTAVGDLLELAYGKALKDSDRDGGDVPVVGSGGIVGRHSRGITDAPSICRESKGQHRERHLGRRSGLAH